MRLQGVLWVGHRNQLLSFEQHRQAAKFALTGLEGECNRNPRGFLRDASLPHDVYHRAAKQSSYMPEDCHVKGPESSPVNLASSTSRERVDSSTDKNSQKPQDKVCYYWISGSCVKGNASPFLR